MSDVLRPDWQHWARVVLDLIRTEAGRRFVGKKSVDFLCNLVKLHTQEVKLLHALGKSEQEGYYKSALLHLAEAQRDYIGDDDRGDLLNSSRKRLLDSLGRVKDDTFMEAMIADKVSTIYLLLGNRAGALDWHQKTLAHARKANATITALEASRAEWEQGGMAVGLGLGAAAALGLAFLCPPLGLATAGVQIAGVLGIQAAGVATLVGGAGVGSHLAGSTVEVPYPLDTVKAFQDAISKISIPQN